jgi:hypothetical protein
LDLSSTGIKNRPKSVESSLLREGCTGLQYKKDDEHIFFVTLNGHRCQLWVAQEWMELETEALVHQRLNRLEVFPFMQHKSLAWVGLKDGKDVIRKIPPSKTFPLSKRQNEGKPPQR